MRTNQKFWHSLVWLSITIIMVGCSTILAPFTPEDTPYGFYPPGVDPRNARSIPADIAVDIQSITEEGVIYRYKEQERQELVESYTQKQQQESSATIQEEEVAEPEPVREVSAESAQPAPEPSVLQNSSGPLAKKARLLSAGPLQKKSKVSLKPSGSYKGGKTVSHVVKKGDTLMEISFDKHGDYLRWREIYRDNRNKMSHWTKMNVGTVLTINNVKYVYIKKDGKPYFIQKGDTLKTISQKIYGTPLLWKALWKNNPQLIRNPGKLYAGFTLYYQDQKKGPSGQPQLREPSAAGKLPVQRIQEEPQVTPAGSPQQILKEEFQKAQ